MNKMSDNFISDFLDYLFDNQEIEGIYVDEHSLSLYYLVRGEGEEKFRVYPVDEELDEFLGHKFYISCGATKAGIIFEDFDEVIKINLTGSLLSVLPDDILEKDEYISDDSYEYSLYNYENNYIELGEKMRNEVDDKIKKILLPHEYRFDYCDLSIYTQKKIELYCCARYSKEAVVVSDRQLIEDTIKCELAYDFVQELINYYKLTKDDLEALDFPDMNYANYGFLPCGVPVINDWEGYWE